MRALFFVLALCTLSCKSQYKASTLEGSVVREDSRPPQRVFHYGEYKYLSPYGDRDSTFTAEEWSKIPSNKYQKLYRQGFYVAQHLAINESFGKLDTSTGPWLAVVDISEECRMNHSLIKYEEDLLKTDDYRMFASRPEFSQLRNKYSCDQFINSNCQKVTDDYYDSKGYWMVIDSAWKNQGYWYIRNPECIERIRTSPAEILLAIAELPESWSKEPFSDTSVKRGGNGTALLIVVMHAFFVSNNLSSDIIDRIYASTTKSDLHPNIKNDFSKFLKITSACVRANKFDQVKPILGKFITEQQNAARTKYGKLIENLPTLANSMSGLEKNCEQ